MILETNDLLQIAGAVVTVLSSLAVSKHQVSKHEATSFVISVADRS